MPGAGPPPGYARNRGGGRAAGYNGSDRKAAPAEVSDVECRKRIARSAAALVALAALGAAVVAGPAPAGAQTPVIPAKPAKPAQQPPIEPAAPAPPSRPRVVEPRRSDEAAAGDETPLQLSADLVTVTVVVRDRSGALVTDLTADDFAVYEDGRRQEVEQVSRRGEIPLQLAFLFDASMSVKPRIDFERRAAARFFATALGPNDRAALFSVATTWKLEQPLTDSAAALAAAAGRLRPEGITSLNDAIGAAAEYLGEARGRRVILLLSDGYDTAERLTLEKALAAVQRADAVVYAVSPAGTGTDFTAVGRIGGASLRRLADDTGGLAFFPPPREKLWQEAEELDRIYARIVEELKAQYVLTYYASESARSGFRSLRVEVRRPGLTVSARKGYIAD